MLSKRVLCLAADKTFAKRMAAGLMAAGSTVETIPTLDELPRGEIKADLVVVHSATKIEELVGQISPRLPAGSHLIALIATSSLDDTVKVMKAGRVSAVLVADEFEPAQLAAVAARLLFGDLFGLEKIVPWGVKVYSMLVGDYQEKSVAIAAVSDFAGSMGVRRKYREAIEQCLDEMLMNALYDAPVDAAGKQMFADVPTKTRISLRMEQKATVEYACDGDTFALSVRDSFGTLKGDTVLKYLDKCLHSDQQMDRKVGGAGLGLYIISNAATQFLVSIHPSVATECTCTFNLDAAKVQLKAFGIFQERIDASGRLVAGRSRLVPPELAGPAPAATRMINVALGAAILSILALIGVVAYPRMRAAATRGAIAISSTPAGASVEIDGVARGSTGGEPLVIDGLTADEKYKVVARRSGYEDAVELVTPHKEPTAVQLVLRPLAATLIVTSVPAGATLYLDGKELGPTPVPLTQLPPGSEHKVRLAKNGYNDLEDKVVAPEPGAKTTAQFALVHAAELSTIRIESDPSGAEILQNGEPLAGVKTPVAEQMLQVGRSYSFTMRLAGYMPETVTVVGKPGTTDPIFVKMKRGGLYRVETNVPEGRVTVVGVARCQGRQGPVVDCALENGKYRVHLASVRPFTAETWTVTVNGQDVTEKVDLGFVETASADLTLKIAGAPPDTRRAAFSDGERRITLVNAKSGLTISKPVKIVAGKTVTVGD
jgi:hypothetical protein